MDLILISEEKLKIILTYHDMLELNMDIESLDYSNVSTKKAFWEILDKAKTTAGFDADKSKLFVQVFPSGDGGCEMFVTKCNSNENLNKHKQINKSKIRNSDKGKFVVSNYENISKLSKRMYEENYLLKSKLYKTEEELYILTLEISQVLPAFYQDRNSETIHYPEYISEYGKTDKLTEKLKAQIDEYCSLIIKDNAIKMLASLSD